MTSIGGLGGGASQVGRHHQPPSFSQLDTNSDNVLSLDELKAGAPGGGTSAAAQKRAEALFKAMDSNGDGSVSSDEKSAFDSKIKDQRQALNFLAQLIAGGQKPPSNDDVFGATDSNGDGSVSLAELSDDPAAKNASPDALQQLFKLIDANSDGAISKDESSAFLDAVKSAVNPVKGGHDGARSNCGSATGGPHVPGPVGLSGK